MSIYGSTYRGAAMLAACTALAGCLGGGGGAGGGGGGGGGGTGAGAYGGAAPTTTAQYLSQVESHAAAVTRYTSVNTANPVDSGPTQNTPITGTANYAGSVHANLNRGATKAGEMLADVEFTIDFAAAYADRTRGVTAGKVSNARGTLDGDLFVLPGEIPLQSAGQGGNLPTVFEITTTDPNTDPRITAHLPPGTPALPIVRTGSLWLNFQGDIEVDGKTGPAWLSLNSAALRPGAEAFSGGAQGAVWDPGNPNPLNAAGDWVASKQ